MLSIFDREFRREKNLEVAKRLADNKKPPAAKGGKDKTAERLESQLADIETKFFEQFPEEESFQKRGG